MKTTNLTTILVSCLLFCKSYSQSDIDAKLPSASEEITKSFISYIDANNKSNVVRLGVLEFENNKEETSELGVFLCDEMTTWLSLYCGGKFTVVSRQDLDKIIKEKEASSQYRTNRHKIEVLRKYQLIDFALTATITQFSEEYRVSIRILSADDENSGSVAAVKILHLNRTSDLDKMFSPIQNNVKSNENGNSSSNNSNHTSFKIGEILEGEAIGNTKIVPDGNGGYGHSVLVNCNGRKIEVFSVRNSSEIDLYATSINTAVIIHFKYQSDGTGEYLSYTTKKK